MTARENLRTLAADAVPPSRPVRLSEPVLQPNGPHKRKKVWLDESPATYTLICARDGLDWPCPAAIVGPPSDEKQMATDAQASEAPARYPSTAKDAE